MKIVTSVVNNPTFIEIQYYTLQKYFKGEYEFIVFNDAKDFPDFTNGNDITIKKQIEDICKKLNIKCINVPNKHHKKMPMSIRHADTFNNHVLKYQKNNLDKYLLLDSDMFLVDYFDINKYSQYDCAIVLQSRNFRRSKINYFCPGFCYLDMTKMKNIELLNWNLVPGCDTGSMMQQWLKKQMGGLKIPTTDEIRCTNKQFHTNNIYFIKCLWSCSWNITELPKNLEDNKNLIEFINNDPRNKNGKFFCEIYDNVFLHYRAGGNWRKEGMDFHNQLTRLLKKVLLKN